MKTPWTEKCKMPDVKLRTVIPAEVYRGKLIIRQVLEAKIRLDAHGDRPRTVSADAPVTAQDLLKDPVYLKWLERNPDPDKTP